MTDPDGVIARARSGDEAAFRSLFRRWQPMLLRYLRGAVPWAWEDVAGEVWVDVVRGLETFTGDDDAFRRWLFTIAHRRAVDVHRVQSRRGEILTATVPEPTAAPDVALIVERHLSTEAAVALIAQLPPDQAEVILLRTVAGLDVATVAAIVGRRAGTVRVQAHRGLTRLAQIIADRNGAVTDPARPAI